MDNNKQKAWDHWNQTKPVPVFTPEQTILWLEGIRELLFEVWKNDSHKLSQWHNETKQLRLKFLSQP